MIGIRRLHLYLGLFLFPWAVLYGVTALLFNHPSWLSEQPVRYFSASSLAGTAIEQRLSPNEQADLLVAKLNEVKQPEVPFARVGNAKYSREFAFGTAKAEGESLSWLVDMKHGSGTIRVTPDVAKPTTRPAPFLANASAAKTPKPPAANTPTERFAIDYPIRPRLDEAMPKVLAQHGYANAVCQVTSVPDVVFSLQAEGEIWQATYNPLTEQLQAISTPEPTRPELSLRRYLTRLHKAHGYPAEANANWYWALVADAMGIVLIFWGVSGLAMWWQMKTTRRLGAVILLVSTVCASVLGWGMYLALLAS